MDWARALSEVVKLLRGKASSQRYRGRLRELNRSTIDSTVATLMSRANRGQSFHPDKQCDITIQRKDIKIGALLELDDQPKETFIGKLYAY